LRNTVYQINFQMFPLSHPCEGNIQDD